MKDYVKKRLRFGLLLTAGLFVVLLFASRSGSGAIPVSSPQKAEGVRLPILMYHNLLMDPALSNDYVVSPEVFEADLVWLLEHGYTPVLIRDVLAYVKGEGDLPEKPVALTFDDGMLNNMVYLLPLLEKYDFCFTLSVIGEYTELFSNLDDANPVYAYLTWEEVTQLSQNPRIEIVNHSYHGHILPPQKGSEQKQAEHRDMQVADALMMRDALVENSGVSTTVYTYPYGIAMKGTDERLRKEGFEVTLMCNEHINTIVRGDFDGLFALGRYNRPSGISTEAFMYKVLGRE